MEKSISIILIISTACILSCKKYEEGPLISLRSKTVRLSNSWILENFFKNGSKNNSIIKAQVVFKKDNRMIAGIFVKVPSSDYSGTWQFIDKKKLK